MKPGYQLELAHRFLRENAETCGRELHRAGWTRSSGRHTARSLRLVGASCYRIDGAANYNNAPGIITGLDKNGNPDTITNPPPTGTKGLGNT